VVPQLFLSTSTGKNFIMNATDSLLSTTAALSSALDCRNLTKSYGDVTVVKNVSLSLEAGKVVGLIGENGAGKSTTASMIAGMVLPDSGIMTIDGEDYSPKNPGSALKSGVAIIHQEIRMIPELSVAENIFLGRLPLRRGVVDRALIEEESAHVLSLLGSNLDPRITVAGLSIAAQQEIEIARALTRKPRYIIFDEPSASLGESETDRVFEQINVMRDSGVGIVYISHRLEEIIRISDSVVCMRDGAVAETWDHGDVDREDLVRAMVGRDFSYGHTAPAPHSKDVAIEVKNLCRSGVFQGISFSVRRGEILGIGGLVGAGRSEVVRVIAGVDSPTDGTIVVSGHTLASRGPKEAIRAGIAMVPEDRKNQGLNLNRTSTENITLPWEKKLSRFGVVMERRLAETARDFASILDIRGDISIPVGRLSGGNQQKVLIGKWLVQKPKVLILDEPTRGVDVGAKMTIYATIRRLAEEGVAVIVVSSEMEEVLGLSHRVLVMAGGCSQGILSRDEATPENVMKLALLSGVNNDPTESQTPNPLDALIAVTRESSAK
jgi:ribose transport system ATP-binding protein